jgi:hypothetical protein
MPQRFAALATVLGVDAGFVARATDGLVIVVYARACRRVAGVFRP